MLHAGTVGDLLSMLNLTANAMSVVVTNITVANSVFVCCSFIEMNMISGTLPTLDSYSSIQNDM